MTAGRSPTSSIVARQSLRSTFMLALPEQLRSGQTAPLQVIVDGTNSNTALIATGTPIRLRRDSRTITSMTASNACRRHSVEAAPQSNWSAALVQRRAYSRWFFVPGVIGSLTLVLVTTLTAFAVVREREIGTLEQMMVTPIRPIEFILGKTLPFFLIGLFDVALIGTIGTFWFRVPFRGSIFVLFAGTVVFLLCMLGIGLFISTVSSTQQQAMVTSFFFIMPAITFSGFGFPISTMPQWLQMLTYLDPLRYFLIVLRGVYLKGIGFDILWPQMAAMLALGVTLLSVSIFRFHKALD